MARHIKFSRTYPAHHPKAGQPTYFVEKFLRSFIEAEDLSNDFESEYVDYYLERKN